MKIELFASGFCEANQYIVNPKSGFKKTSFYAVWALIELPQIGYIMFDTGYSNAFHEATKRFPERFYRMATPMSLKSGESAIEILRRKGIHHSEIKYIIISHFHADHVAGLSDFPESKFICSQKAFHQTNELDGFAAVKSGIIKKLLPKNFIERLYILEDIADRVYKNEFGITEYRLFQQSTFKLLYLPGHARGMLGFKWNTAERNLLFGTDAAWDYDCFIQEIMPSPLVKIFIDSWSELQQSMQQLKSWKKQENNMQILFTHCPKTLSFIENEI